jgi:hypothetical protein
MGYIVLKFLLSFSLSRNMRMLPSFSFFVTSSFS